MLQILLLHWMDDPCVSCFLSVSWDYNTKNKSTIMNIKYARFPFHIHDIRISIQYKEIISLEV